VCEHIGAALALLKFRIAAKMAVYKRKKNTKEKKRKNPSTHRGGAGFAEIQNCCQDGSMKNTKEKKKKKSSDTDF
jgi:hypothetical protein